MRTLKIRDFVPPGQHIHFARNCVNGELPLGAHTHDFHEFFVIDAGEGVHHVNGREIPLRAGHLVLMRDRDRHGFTGKGLIIANAAFSRSTLQHLQKRYFAQQPDFYEMRSRQPHMRLLDVSMHAWLKERMDRLDASTRNALDTDLFLMDVFQRLNTSAVMPSRQTGNIPDWIRQACEAAARPEILAGGAPALSHWAGKSPEHLSREMKRWTGRTPTDWITEARMRSASRKLATGSDSILEISFACGYESLGHFYQVFKKHAGISPRKYRLQAGKITGL